MERLAKSYESEAANVRQKLAIAHAQLRDYQERSGEPFAHEAYLAELTALRDALRASLSGASPAAAGKTRPTMLELADRIKALQTGQTVDALPRRTSALRESISAEPIIERIRHRIGVALTA